VPCVGDVMNKLMRAILLCSLGGFGGFDDDFSDDLDAEFDRLKHPAVSVKTAGAACHDVAAVFHSPDCTDPACVGIPSSCEDWIEDAGGGSGDIGDDRLVGQLLQRWIEDSDDGDADCCAHDRGKPQVVKRSAVSRRKS